jgi:hypothetical protein
MDHESGPSSVNTVIVTPADVEMAPVMGAMKRTAEAEPNPKPRKRARFADFDDDD